MKRIARLLLGLALTAVLVIAIILYVKNGGNVSGATASTVRLNEVMTSNKGSVPDSYGNYPDWVELYNDSDKAADISGYGLSDDLTEGPKYVFPSGTKIEAHSYLIVYCSGENTDKFHAAFRLSTKDELVFLNTTGKVADSLNLIAVASGKTLARQEGGTKWQEMSPSPGYPNTEEGAKAFEASLQGTEDIGVYINEFMASNKTTLMDSYGNASDWIELYNSNDKDVDLSGFGISDSLDQPMKYQLPKGTTIPAKGCLLIFCSGNEKGAEGSKEVHAPFGLRAYEEDVVLTAKNGRIVDSFSFSRQENDMSMARVPDGTGEFQSSATPSPGYPNTAEGQAAFAKNTAMKIGDLYISEIMGANSTALVQSDGNSYDWIELHNAGNTDIGLSGYALSDNANNPAKWVFPDVTIKAGAYMVVLASGNDVKDTQKKNLETNFRLSSDGDMVLLYSPEAKLLDKLQCGHFSSDVSCGRDASGATAYFTAATPGAKNGNGYSGVTSTPRFLTVPGIYDAPVTVTIAAGAGETIHYTTDCTAPTASSPVYNGPIPVSKNTVVRAVALRDGCLTGYTNTGTFLFTTDGVNHSVQVVALATDPKNLWDGKTGIYAYGDNFNGSLPLEEMLKTANYYQRGDAWERAGSFEVFSEDTKKQAFQQNIDMRIAGGYGRSRAQKGFNITARSEYGKSRMAYKFFENREYTSYKAVVLRAGAQDQSMSKIRDELSSGLLEGMDVNVLVQAYKPCVLYLNGEYWGMYFLKEKRNRFFVAQHEGTENTDDMDIVKSSSLTVYGSNAEWKDLMAYVNSHDLSNAAYYKYVSDRLDVTSFMDYMVCELYVANSDYANIEYYKLPGGKWKWIYYDFCWGWYNVNHTTITNRRGEKPAASGLFNALLKNKGWKDAFVRRFAELMKTIYDPARVNAKIDELYAVVITERAREMEKFNGRTFMGKTQIDHNVSSMSSFEKHVSRVRDFANKRPAIIKAELQSQLGLSDAYMKEVFGE